MRQLRAFLILSALLLYSTPAHAVEYVACVVNGVVKICPNDARLKSGSVFQSAYLPIIPESLGGFGVNVSALGSGFLRRAGASSYSASPLVVGDIPTGIPATSIGGGSVGNTAFGYIANLASDAQTQLNGKQATFGSQAANTVYAAPNGSAGVPSFRALVGNDVPWNSAPIQVNAYTTPGSATWTVPAIGNYAFVQCRGGGGGGGSGRRSENGFGGGGGGGSRLSFWLFRLADLGPAGTMASIIVGAGGAGGAAVNFDNADGAQGATGGTSFFGFNSLDGSALLVAGGGTGGSGGTLVSGAGGSSLGGAGAMFLGGDGSSGGLFDGDPGSLGSIGSGGGGGGGGEGGGGDTFGGTGGLLEGLGALQAPGSQLLTVVGANPYLGGSGGSGGDKTGGVALAGQNGGLYGGGGGGGAGGPLGVPSGKGGDGAPGVCVVSTYL